ncbi:phosphotransferase [Mastigocladopsis repens]|uniref:phosphotransferase n=1 Tax=Mastigocladopsis repens TaxID=221287 RepID=UPI0002EA151E|nr:phosphotransferase [Mastigocladopsis repens]
MTFVLSSQNVLDYLIEQGLCTPEEKAQSEIEQKYAKNFNLLLTLPQGRKLLVKQEPRNREGKTAGEFLREWQIHEFLQKFTELNQMHFWLSEGIYFNAQHSIIVLNYLENYRDLMNFYAKENIFPTEIATAIGTILANIHRLTLGRQDYQDFFAPKQENQSPKTVLHLVKKIERIGPEIFGLVPADGLKFYSLYQRYDSLGQAIAELGSSLVPCCLTHNDLKLNNILLSHDWQQVNPPLIKEGNSMVRFIDWERCGWGDPALDLGTLIGSYLLIWLRSLITSKTMSLDESLGMATTPLEQIQPSLAALASAYFADFPEILEHRPDFLQRVVQSSGWNLITAIQSMLQYQKSFGNMGICMLQVAKSLLCRPEASIPTIFGMEASALTRTSLSLA